jgi:hypothetical protein
VPPPESSSSPTATAVTTPSKPYIPKDHPSTPAVVISEALAESTPPKEDRARIAQTIPGQTRSNPAAVVAAVPFPVAASSPVLDDTYPPLRRRGSKLPLVFAGGLLLAAGGFAFTKLTASSMPDGNESASASPAPVVAPIATVAPTNASPTPAAEAPAPTQPSEPVASADTKADVAASQPAPPPPPASKKTKAKKVTAAPAPRRPASRPEPKAEAKPSAPAAEPAATPAPKPAKGVIVRETPF